MDARLPVGVKARNGHLSLALVVICQACWIKNSLPKVSSLYCQGNKFSTGKLQGNKLSTGRLQEYAPNLLVGSHCDCMQSAAFSMCRQSAQQDNGKECLHSITIVSASYTMLYWRNSWCYMRTFKVRFTVHTSPLSSKFSKRCFSSKAKARWTVTTAAAYWPAGQLLCSAHRNRLSATAWYYR